MTDAEYEAHKAAVAWRISDDEARIRSWIELNTIGRDDPGGPVRFEIRNLISLCESIDVGRREISRCNAVIRELEERVSETEENAGIVRLTVPPPSASAMERARHIVPPISLSNLRGLSRETVEALEDKWITDTARAIEQARAAAFEDAAEALPADYVFHDDNPDLQQRARVVANTFRSAIRGLAAAEGQLEPGQLTREQVFYAKGRAAGIEEAAWQDQDGWVAWHGWGSCPIPDGVAWEYRLRGDSQGLRAHYNASKLRWDHRNGRGDIVAYRVVRP